MLPTEPVDRFELLLDLYAPVTEDETGALYREPANGIIDHDTFMVLLSTEAGDA